MSESPPFFVAPTEALQDTRLTRADLKVLFALCSFYNRRTKRCFPSRRALGERAGVSRSTVGTSLQDLEFYGWIVRIHDYNERGAQRANNYEIRFGDSLLESFTPMPDASAPPLTEQPAPLDQDYRHPPDRTHRQQGDDTADTKQRTEPRSELTSEPTQSNTPATAPRLRTSVEEPKPNPAWWKDPAIEPWGKAAADA